jgi:predicted nucleotide-binding protein
MARSKPPARPEQEPPQVPAVQGIQLIESQIAKAEELLKSRPLGEDDHSTWELLTRNYLEKAFGRHSPNVRSVTDVGKYGSFPWNAGEQWWEAHRADILQTQTHKLAGLLELLKTELQLSGGKIATVASEPSGHKIFLVHGHDDRALHETARFLETLQQDVIVLREQANQGRTVIEKFEDYADVGFAVILLTPDDVGNSKAAADDGQFNSRAWQNVVFEFGYFIGRLGRNRVCALYIDGVEIPSDYSGVLYTKLDANGGWRLELAKELKAAGLPVDMNLAL